MICNIMLISLENATDLLLEALLADAERESEIYAQLAAMPEATRQALQKIPKLWEAWQALKKRCEPQDYGWCRWLADLQQTTESERFESLRQQATVHYMDWAPSTFSETQWQALLCPFAESGTKAHCFGRKAPNPGKGSRLFYPSAQQFLITVADSP